METGLNFAAIRAALDEETWEDEHGGQVRRVFLGSVFSLTPSGKYYLPFACSNVMGCAKCGGTGTCVNRYSKRQRARALRRQRDFSRNTIKRGGAQSVAGKAYCERVRTFRHRACLVTDNTCQHCGGTGSREAYLDECWREAVESDMAEIGASLENGEGDPCDLFAVEYRDAPDTDEDDDE